MTLVSLKPGYLELHSHYQPGLSPGEYTASVAQTVSAVGQSTTLSSSQTFHVVGPEYYVDPTKIHSLYPVSGHSEGCNILPHIVLNDAHLPWERKLDGPSVHDDDNHRTPWMALLVFDHDEIALMPNELRSTTEEQSSTLSVKLSPSILQEMIDSKKIAALPTIGPASSIDMIFVKDGVFESICNSYEDGPELKRKPFAPGDAPNLDRYKYLAHIRKINTEGTAEDSHGELGDDKIKEYSVVISHRSGPLNLQKPQTVYVHLVSLDGVQNMTAPFGGDSGRVALVSLYSWTYNCAPREELNLTHFLETLGSSLQPLRVSDSHFKIPPPNPTCKDEFDRMMARLKAGYTVIKYRTQAGDVVPAFMRGPLIPNFEPAKMDNLPAESSFGTDLQIMDKHGIIDLTYSMAWQLGKSLALSNQTFSASMMRTRNRIHTEALKIAKPKYFAMTTQTPGTSKHDIIKELPKFQSLLQQASDLTLDISDLSRRWTPTPVHGSLSRRTRAMVSFGSDSIKNVYRQEVRNVTQKISGMPVASPRAIVDMVSDTPSKLPGDSSIDPPKPSSDWKVIEEWCLDKLRLTTIPPHYLFPDVNTLPAESMRTFYVDDSWTNYLIDGALSIANHFGPNDDVIKREIKQQINTFLATKSQETGSVPRIPRWGYVLRSSHMAAYKSLVVQAPWSDANDKRKQIMLVKDLREDVLLVLFDRVPGTDFPQGITISQAPHQQFYACGEEVTSTYLRWQTKKIFSDKDTLQDFSSKDLKWPVIKWEKEKGDLEGPAESQDYLSKNEKLPIYDWDSRTIIMRNFGLVLNTILNKTFPAGWDVPFSSVVASIQLNQPASKLQLGFTQDPIPTPIRALNVSEASHHVDIKPEVENSSPVTTQVFLPKWSEPTIVNAPLTTIKGNTSVTTSPWSGTPPELIVSCGVAYDVLADSKYPIDLYVFISPATVTFEGIGITSVEFKIPVAGAAKTGIFRMTPETKVKPTGIGLRWVAHSIYNSISTDIGIYTVTLYPRTKIKAFPNQGEMGFVIQNIMYNGSAIGSGRNKIEVLMNCRKQDSNKNWGKEVQVVSTIST